MKSNTEISENRFLGSISASSLRNLLPRSVSGKQKMNPIQLKSKFNSENTPPIDPNIQVEKNPFSNPKKSESQMAISHTQVTRSDGHQESPTPPDPPVKAVVRIRPCNHHERVGDRTVRKISDDSVSVANRKFTFDSVLDSNSNQEDIFQVAGVPLVKNALAGYNTSVLAYGETGSGKTYTMWGPPSSMVEGHSGSSHQGIVPRIFQTLFSEIQREQENLEGKQINYQCRCSFLEVYNEQIGDLLDPIQRNLEIKDDAKNGLYVENLSEEYVTSYEDVTQLLIKGLSSRKVGATSINSKSSRSHIVFTCVIESWCKGHSSKCFGSSKTSRISFIDLAGQERNKLDDASRQCVKEEKNVKKSLSQLGHLVKFLAEGAQSRKAEDVPYRSSTLTHLLKESLGGNAKLTVICTISQDDKSTGESLSTLRFGQRVKYVQNNPVINEITEDDVNGLSDQIRQLKEELIRTKSNVCNSVGSNYGYLKGRSVRGSLNQLRLSLNRSLILPRIDNDPEKEVDVNEDDVKELCLQLDNLHSSCEDNTKDSSEFKDCIQFSSLEEGSETDLTSEHDTSHLEESENEEINLEKGQVDESPQKGKYTSVVNLSSTFSISACRQNPVLEDPPFTESPKIATTLRKSIAVSADFGSSQNMVLKNSKSNLDVLRQSQKQNDVQSSLRSSKIFPGPTESLAASLQRGLQIIDYHQRNSSSIDSSVAFSFDQLTLKPCQAVDKPNASVQTSVEARPSSDGQPASFLCPSCQRTGLIGSNEVQDSLKAWIVDGAENSNGLGHQVPKDTGEDLAEAIKSRDELENICTEQASKIEQLNLLIMQYKHEREHNPTAEHSSPLLLEGGLVNEAIQTDESKSDKFHSQKDENKYQLLRWDEPEMVECEIKEVREELDYGCRNTFFDMNEKDALLKEIQALRSQLQSYTDASPKKSTERLRSSSLLLSQSIQLRKSGVLSQGNSEEELEKERQRWMEMESEWICLTDELRIDLESMRRHAEKVEKELRLEKNVTEELDDALKRAVLGHARMVEHYTELQEKYNDLAEKHRMIMEGIAEVKRAAAKAGNKGHGSRFAKSLAAELSVMRVERERERELLKKENKSLRIQLRDTAEAVHAAGELLVRLREAEESASISEENFTTVREENDKLKKQVEKLKRKHKMEMITMKQYLAESRLPEAALRPLYREDSDIAAHNSSSTVPDDDDQAWRAEFGAIYQDHHY